MKTSWMNLIGHRPALFQFPILVADRQPFAIDHQRHTFERLFNPEQKSGLVPSYAQFARSLAADFIGLALQL